MSRAVGRGRRSVGGRAGAGAAATPGRTAADAPLTIVEREALKLALQEPVLAGPIFDAIDAADYAHPVHVAVRQAIADVGGRRRRDRRARSGSRRSARPAPTWPAAAARRRAGGRAAAPRRRARSALRRRARSPGCSSSSVTRRIREVKSRVQRVNPVTHKDEYLALVGELFSLEQHARALREQAVGGL